MDERAKSLHGGSSLQGFVPYDASPDLSYFHYEANYLRNSRAIGVLWAVFTMCYAIINVVVFVQPQWVWILSCFNSTDQLTITTCTFSSWPLVGPSLPMTIDASLTLYTCFHLSFHHWSNTVIRVTLKGLLLKRFLFILHEQCINMSGQVHRVARGCLSLLSKYF